MKQFLILLFIVPFFSMAQIKQRGFITYQYQKPSENLKFQEAILEFDKDKSMFIYGSSDLTEQDEPDIKRGDMNVKVNLSASDSLGFQVYRDFSNKTLVNRYPKTAKMFDAFVYKDSWIPINWNIEDKFKNIGKFRAQKAIGEFRGRIYTVWFTEEIPLPYGPWKLFGLPGLVLEAEDSEKMFQVKFVSIKYPCNDCESNISKPTENEEKTLKEYVDFSDNFNDYIYKKIMSKMPRDMAKRIRQGTKTDNGRKYKDEKKFEWEE